MTDLFCDLVLEGGGVKGIGLVGAVETLHKAQYNFQRIAGTSAGAIVGSLLASGISVERLVELMQSLDYTKFQDESGILDHLGLAGKTASLIFQKGIYQGIYLHNWLRDQLAELGVQTFADLKLTEPWAQKLPPEQRYKLVVITSDVTQGRLVRLPWDYKELYGLDPDSQSVADAVRASMSIPFFYKPYKLQRRLLVDGGMLSNFPIDLFDTTNQWPTFGLKLSSRSDALMHSNPTSNSFEFATAILDTLTNAHDRMHIDNPATQKRTIFIDTSDIKATDFSITPAQQHTLYQSGKTEAADFLKTWNYDSWKKFAAATKRVGKD
ncbi:MAG TPA: patatin-like phospholipase family protein [Candidatus Saccharimonadia bacterium]|nr:patatin-like phospholipase family protein [Candidatus Saccharimonadia bacterium]